MTAVVLVGTTGGRPRRGARGVLTGCDWPWLSCPAAYSAAQLQRSPAAGADLLPAAEPVHQDRVVEEVSGAVAGQNSLPVGAQMVGDAGKVRRGAPTRADHPGCLGNEAAVAVAAVEQQLARLSSPIGLDLGSRTPQETAVSIVAEIIARQWGGSGEPLSGISGSIHSSSRGS